MAHLRSYLRVFSVLVLVALVASQGLIPVSADNTPHVLCTGTTPNVFSQNWTNTSLITANDDWAGVPSIVGYLGDIDAGTTAGIDPRTRTTSLLGAVDVIANQNNPSTLVDGGVAEFQITNPVVALQGVGVADAPSLVVTLNTTGTSNTTIAYTVRDIDSSPDDAIQQFNVQYRIGLSGGWTNVPGGYIADASVGGGTQDTPVAAYALPAFINNAGTVQIRFMTTNALPSADEWLGVDDIVITPTCTPDPCASVIFPYTLPNNTPATLRTAIQCANTNGTADVIDFNGQTVTLTEIYGDFDGATGLPRITSDITLRNGTLTRSGSDQFRLIYIAGTGILTVRDMTLSNGGGATYSAGAGIIYAASSSSLNIWRSLITGQPPLMLPTVAAFSLAARS